jgi:hypothetical protein
MSEEYTKEEIKELLNQNNDILACFLPGEELARYRLTTARVADQRIANTKAIWSLEKECKTKTETNKNLIEFAKLKSELKVKNEVLEKIKIQSYPGNATKTSSELLNDVYKTVTQALTPAEKEKDND